MYINCPTSVQRTTTRGLKNNHPLYTVIDCKFRDRAWLKFGCNVHACIQKLERINDHLNQDNYHCITKSRRIVYTDMYKQKLSPLYELCGPYHHVLGLIPKLTALLTYMYMASYLQCM